MGGGSVGRVPSPSLHGGISARNAAGDPASLPCIILPVKKTRSVPCRNCCRDPDLSRSLMPSPPRNVLQISVSAPSIFADLRRDVGSRYGSAHLRRRLFARGHGVIFRGFAQFSRLGGECSAPPSRRNTKEKTSVCFSFSDGVQHGGLWLFGCDLLALWV